LDYPRYPQLVSEVTVRLSSFRGALDTLEPISSRNETIWSCAARLSNPYGRPHGLTPASVHSAAASAPPSASKVEVVEFVPAVVNAGFSMPASWNRSSSPQIRNTEPQLLFWKICSNPS
jgi:hypothetical protein